MTAAFDSVAARYAELWSETAAGRQQREAVWRAVDPLFPRGSRVLDLGCGTGDDALHLSERGVHVLGIDESPEMIRIARARGLGARVLPIERISELDRRFDGALSNFGALNCLPSLDGVARDLSRLIVPGGKLAICVIGKCCAGEIARGEWAKAARRLRASAPAKTLGIRVYYPTSASIETEFAPEFKPIGRVGIGVADAIARWPVMRSLGDHRLYLFERV